MSWYGALVAGLLLLILLAIATYTVITGTPAMPSSNKARAEVLRQLASIMKQGPPKTIVDLGSGWGNLVIPIARLYSQHRVIGYELSLFPWLVSVLAKRLLRLDNLVLYRKDFLKADLSQADILLCYLFPKAMTQLDRKIRTEQLKLQALISVFFALPGHPEDRKEVLRDLYNTPVYLYCFWNRRANRI